MSRSPITKFSGAFLCPPIGDNMELGAVGLDLSVELVGGGIGAVFGFILLFLRRHTANAIRALWRPVRSVVLRVMAWTKEECRRCWQQLKEAPLPLQVAAVLFVFNGWGIIALETYAGTSIGLLHVLHGMFLMAAFGLIGYGLVLRLRLRWARARTKGG